MSRKNIILEKKSAADDSKMNFIAEKRFIIELKCNNEYFLKWSGFFNIIDVLIREQNKRGEETDGRF